MARTDPTIYMRIPAELKEAIDAASSANKRSVTAEVVARLQASFETAEEASGRELDASLTGLQSMLAFHVREFFDLLPAEVKAKPINKAVRDLAFAMGHGPVDQIEASLREYFNSDGESGRFALVAREIHQRREQLDAIVAAHDDKDPTPLSDTVDYIKAKPVRPAKR